MTATPRSVNVEPLLPRTVELHFEEARPDWNREQPELGHLLNAMSTVLPHLEPFLIKTVRAAARALPEDRTELRRDIELFAFQEAVHYRNHQRLNRRLEEAGYADVRAFEARARADYKRFWDRGLKFSLAYAEGFEAQGPILASYLFENREELGFTDLDEPGQYLFLWHLAEEFEHRTVCNDLYRELYDDHWYRRFGVWFATIHLFRHALLLTGRMMRVDREAGLGRTTWSKIRLARILGGLLRGMLPRLVIGVMRRDYDPATLPEPTGMREFLAEVAERHGIADRPSASG